MRRLALLATLPLALAAAGDQIPLKRGIFVMDGVACKGASNAAIMSYWGGTNAINVSGATCKLIRARHVGQRYSIERTCTDVRSGEPLGRETVSLSIADPSRFTMDGHSYRWCGMQVEF